MTSTRSAMPSTSGSSLEIISTATPWPASSLISRWTSAFVPTSMPRVGSSTISTFGLGGEPLAEHDLLLVAARERADGVAEAVVLELQPRGPLLGQRVLGAAADQAGCERARAGA